MSRQIQFRRGTADEHKNFTGAEGEITVDLTNKTLRVHDGVTAGGTMLAKKSEIPEIANADYLVESQLPTVENNYTWYRKYKSGWVEMGGTYDKKNEVITLPITMTSDTYGIALSFCSTSGNNCQYNSFTYTNKTTKGFTIINSGTISGNWFVCGK